MPRFYFNVYNDVTALDDEGIDLPDIETARQAALGGARDLAADQVKKGRLNLTHRIDIVDEGGSVVA
jgi:hypothetical protein